MDSNCSRLGGAVKNLGTCRSWSLRSDHQPRAELLGYAWAGGPTMLPQNHSITPSDNRASCQQQSCDNPRATGHFVECHFVEKIFETYVENIFDEVSHAFDEVVLKNNYLLLKTFGWKYGKVISSKNIRRSVSKKIIRRNGILRNESLINLRAKCTWIIINLRVIISLYLTLTPLDLTDYT